MIELSGIEHVLLDLDGTLLDRHFDDHFWHNFVPEKYAAHNGMAVDEARAHLLGTYRSQEKTLNWTDLDFWSRELGLDIPALKYEMRGHINVLPHAEEFLGAMRAAGKGVHLLTNAHIKSIRVKFDKTGIGGHFHSIITSNEVGVPKEFPGFWREAEARTGFDPERSIFIDDTHDVLRAARRHGIRHVVFKGRSSSRLSPAVSGEFPTITDFDELLDGAVI